MSGHWYTQNQFEHEVTVAPFPFHEVPLHEVDFPVPRGEGWRSVGIVRVDGVGIFFYWERFTGVLHKQREP